MTTGKTIALTRRTFVDKVMSLLFNMLSRLVITFLQRSKHPLDCKEIQPVHPKGDQSWVFIGKTDVEAETPILWSPAAKSWLIWKDPDAGEDWRQEKKGMAEDEMVGSLTQWTWIWADSSSWWWTGRPGMLPFMGSQKVRHDWATELNWTDTLSKCWSNTAVLALPPAGHSKNQLKVD